jgi:hypothetical protein
MSNYTKATNFAAKDSLPSGNAGKIIKGTEIDTEFNAIASAISSKADTNSPTLTGTPLAPTASAGTSNTQIATTAFVSAADTTAITDERTATATLTNKTISGSSNTISNLSATNLTSGTVPDARFPATLPAASGANLTALNASQLTSGTMPLARMPAGTIVKVSSIVFSTRTVTSSAATYDLSIGSFTKTYNSATSDIIVVGTIPCYSFDNAAGYLNLKIGSTAKYTGIATSQISSNAFLMNVSQYWTGLGAGSQSVSTGWASANSSSNRPINAYCPNSTDDARNQQSGIELIIYEVLK